METTTQEVKSNGAILASLDTREKAVAVKKGSALSKINVFSQKNIERRKARETNTDNIISPQTPITVEDMAPHMEVHIKATDAVLAQMNESMALLAEKFSGTKLFALTEENARRSVDKVAEAAFKAEVTRQLVNTMMQNLEAHKIFGEKLMKVRMAAGQNDVATLVDELIEFAKFFDASLWSKMNVATETVWAKTGFAIGRFTRDFHLQWMRLLQDPFVQSVMSAVADAAKSLASYKENSESFVKQRKEIEAMIGENPVLEKLRNELMDLFAQYQAALAECQRLTQILENNRKADCPSKTLPISEAEVQAARALANELDYKVQQAMTKFQVATGATITADENAAAARLAGHAIELHVRTVAELFFSCGMFILNTAAFFAAKQLLSVANQARALFKQSEQVAGAHGVKSDIKQLEQKRF